MSSFASAAHAARRLFVPMLLATTCLFTALSSARAAESQSTSEASNHSAIGWRFVGTVGAGFMPRRACDQCPERSARGLTFGAELGAPLASGWQLVLGADTRLLGYGRGATSTLSDLNLALQWWPRWRSGGTRNNLWLRGGASVASLSTSLGEETTSVNGKVIQFVRRGPGLSSGIGYEFPHGSRWTFELSFKLLAARLPDAVVFSGVTALGVAWH